MALTLIRCGAHSQAKKPGQAHDAALAGGVGRHTDPALEGEHRGDVDDLSARFLPDELPGRRLGEEEHRLEVDVHHLVPVLLGEIDGIAAPDDAGIVDKDVDLPQARDRLAHDVGRGGDVRQVRLDTQKAPTQPFDHALRVPQVVEIDGDDIGAGLRQPAGHPLPQPRPGAGHDGDFSVQVELIENH